VATLTITRPRQYADMLRTYHLIVDGHDAATIRAGEDVDIELSRGRHRVMAAIDWAHSYPVEIDVLPGGHYHLEVGSNMAGWRLLLAIAYATIWRDRYLYLKDG
jgi:hypothetical protein